MKRTICMIVCLFALQVQSQPTGEISLPALRLREATLAGDRILQRSPLLKSGIVWGQVYTIPALDGSYVSPKIVNPDGAATNGQFPFMVAIGGVGPDKRFKPFCGGSVIHPRYVLTAAHCAAEVQANLTQVIWGQTNLAKMDLTKISKVVDIFTHEGYLNLTGNQYDNDVALLYVDPPIKTAPVLLADSGPQEPDQSLVVMAGVRPQCQS